jgi:hypothetical protein
VLQVAQATDKYAARQVHALVVAAYTGDLGAVEQLLADGAQADAHDYDGCTPLQVGGKEAGPGLRDCSAFSVTGY